MPLYSREVPREQPVAILGSQNRFVFSENDDVDLYDISFSQNNRWDINSDWSLQRSYKTIVSTRCPYFSKAPISFFERCAEHLIDDGKIFFDFGLGDHWRLDPFKIGWLKDGYHESAYFKENFLWSTLWCDEIAEHPETKKFAKWCKAFGYFDKTLTEYVFDEVPKIISFSDISRFYNVEWWDVLALWPESPQLYIFVRAKKK